MYKASTELARSSSSCKKPLHLDQNQMIERKKREVTKQSSGLAAEARAHSF
jgi:hypothetical protein